MPDRKWFASGFGLCRFILSYWYSSQSGRRHSESVGAQYKEPVNILCLRQ